MNTTQFEHSAWTMETAENVDTSSNIRFCREDFSSDEMLDLNPPKEYEDIDISDGEHNVPPSPPSGNITFLDDDFSSDHDHEDLGFSHLQLDEPSANITFDVQDFSSDQLDIEIHDLYFERDSDDSTRLQSNIRFLSEDFSSDSDTGVNQTFIFSPDDESLADEDDNDTGQLPKRVPKMPKNRLPPGHSPKSTQTRRRHDAFINSLLDEPDKAATKEDLAVFAQMIQDRYKKEQKIREEDVQRIEALEHRNDPEDPNYDADTPDNQVHKRRARKQRKGTKVELCRLVRKFAFKLMKRTPAEGKNPSPIISATLQDVNRFLNDPTNPEKGPKKHKFVLDFNGRSGSGSPWNKRATLVFADEFVRKNPGHSKDHVIEAFKTHIFHLKKKYIAYAQYIDDSARMGDEAADLRSNENKIHISRMSRRSSLGNRRAKACSDFITSSAEMSQFEEVWKLITVEAISGDESDHDQGTNRYIITKLPWRAPWIHDWMLVFDRLHLLKRFTDAGRATPGAFPHIRILGREERIDRHCITPPVGLPRNFYCPDWLSNQTPAFIASLQMLDPIDLKFSKKILKMAAQCKYVTSHDTPPIPLEDVESDQDGSEEDDQDDDESHEHSISMDV